MNKTWRPEEGEAKMSEEKTPAPAATTIEVVELQRLNLQPGEILVVQVPSGTNMQSLRNYGRVFEHLLPTTRVLLTKDQLTFMAIAPDDAPAVEVIGGEEKPKKSFCDDCNCGKAEGCGR